MNFTLTRQQAFRMSYYSFTLAFLTIVGIPVGCSITGRDNSGWDFLSDDINFLSTSAVLLIVFLLSSLFSGLYALKQHRVVAIWVVPLGVVFVIAIGSSFWGIYVYIFDPYGTS